MKVCPKGTDSSPCCGQAPEGWPGASGVDVDILRLWRFSSFETRKTPRCLPSSLTRRARERENQGRAFPMLHWDRSKNSLTLHIILTDSMTLFTFKHVKNKNSSGFPYDMCFWAGMECRWVSNMCCWDPESFTALKGCLTFLFWIKRKKLSDSSSHCNSFTYNLYLCKYCV